MQFSSKFTIAIHILTCIDYFAADNKVTSKFLAASIQVNPVIVRQILGQLQKHDLVTVKRGAGGATLQRPLSEISFFDVFQAVDVGAEQMFKFHDQPNPDCPVGRNIQAALQKELDPIQTAFETKLKNTSVATVAADVRAAIAAS